ncbi:hypothetical protein KY360_03340 [Candidatus Woesearchaeota archaeon]|nr:hypothetical protein [Candidatus Woesearchaeota archaeon]
MSIKNHLIFTIIISIIIAPIVRFNALYFIIGSVLIDVDHYLYYIMRYRKFNLGKIYTYWAKHPNKFAKESICVFHTLEFISVVIVLSFFSFKAFILASGILFHLVLDFYNEFVIMKLTKHYSLFGYLLKRIS